MNVQNPIETEQLGMMGAFVSSVPLVVIALDFPRTLSSLVPNGVWENLWYKRACFSLPRAQSPAPLPLSLSDMLLSHLHLDGTVR